MNSSRLANFGLVSLDFSFSLKLEEVKKAGWDDHHGLSLLMRRAGSPSKWAMMASFERTPFFIWPPKALLLLLPLLLHHRCVFPLK